MRYNRLIFNEVSDIQSMASHHLELGYGVQITFDSEEMCNNCVLYNEKGSIVDNEEGLDTYGVEEFIERSEELVTEMKETMMAMSM
jgi:hypothetical protein